MKNRIFGLENEYGLIFSPTGKVYLPMEKILGYIFDGLIPNSWPSNAFLCNGARFYQDTGCHPEYATPECDNVFDLVVHDKAGERILESCLPVAERRLKEEGLAGTISIYKNNTDSMGNTYGCHENYLIRRDIDFWKVAEQLIPFFVTRIVYTGTGKVLKSSGKSHYFISQRAQHIHEKTSSSTTSSRSIINTRDEPHADAEKYRRLHIIVGDSNMSEYATYLKVGTTALILSMIESGFLVSGMTLEDPVKAMREISRDLTLKKKIRMENGKELTAIEIQREYLATVKEYLASEDEDEATRDIVEQWEYVLDELEEEPERLYGEIDWITKRGLIHSFMERKECGMDDPRVALIDLQYHDINREKGLYYLLAQKDIIQRMATEEDIQNAMQNPPETTRAKVRGDFIRFAKVKNRSYTVDWTYLKLNGYWEETILCMDPFASSNPRLKALIATATPHK
ncbi:MAG: Pup--protein ligase [Nitrospirae bacterium]|nr:Pup--protein ligase [Candidatus Troglogloeales bacterium]MBI3598111.1 Pup--protein ligase [Candidatus Troglogloeales bacterium]